MLASFCFAVCKQKSAKISNLIVSAEKKLTCITLCFHIKVIFHIATKKLNKNALMFPTVHKLDINFNCIDAKKCIRHCFAAVILWSSNMIMKKWFSLSMVFLSKLDKCITLMFNIFQDSDPTKHGYILK